MEFNIDLTGITCPRDLQQRVAEALPCPEYYGFNLDALYDVLTEQGDGWCVLITGCAGADELLPGYMRSLRKMCRAAEEETENMEIHFLP